MSKTLPSVRYLHEVLEYTPDTGEFFYRSRPVSHFDGTEVVSGRSLRARWNGRFAGKLAGTVDERGYVTIRIDGVKYRAHRIAWKMMTGEDPSAEVDHINGARADNRFCNLRLATRAQNSRNRKPARRGSSRYLGVTWSKPRGLWVAQSGVGGRTRYIGGFANEVEAAQAYDAHVREHGCEYSRLNFPS